MNRRYEEEVVDLTNKVKWRRYQNRNQEVASMENDLQVHHDELEQLRGSREKFEKVIEENDKNIQECKESCRESERKRDELGNELKTIRQKIKATRPALNQVQQELRVLSQNIRSEQENIHLIQNNINSIENEMKAQGNNRQERIRQVNEINTNIIACETQLSKLRNEFDSLQACPEAQSSYQASLHDEQQRTDTLRRNMQSNQNNINNLQNNIRLLNNQSMTKYELFLPPSLQKHNMYNNRNRRGGGRLNRNNNNVVTMASILGHINSAAKRGKFRGPKPIGPLGYYIDITDAKFVGIVQACLGDIMYTFVCDNNDDSAHMTKIFRQMGIERFVPMVTRKYDGNRHRLSPNNQFSRYTARVPINDRNYNLSDYNGVYRILDLINVRDPNDNNNNNNNNRNNQNQNQNNRNRFNAAGWVFNTIVDRVAPERCFAHGNLEQARTFVHSLAQNQLHQVDAVYTLHEDAGSKLMRVVKRGGAVSGTAISSGAPILGTDPNTQRNYYQQQIHNLQQQNNQIQQQIQGIVNNTAAKQQKINQIQRQIQNGRRLIGREEGKLEDLQRRKDRLEDNNDEIADGKQAELQEYYDNLRDSQAALTNLENEMQPKREEKQRLERQRQELKKEIDVKGESIPMLQENVDRMLDRINDLDKSKAKNRKLSQKAQKYLAVKEKNIRQVEQRLNILREECDELGDEAKQGCEECPQFGAKDTIIAMEKQIKVLKKKGRNWIANHDCDKIEREFKEIEPKWLNHEQKVQNCKTKLKLCERNLQTRQKEYSRMKDQVRNKLMIRFSVFMQNQGHQGKLYVDYENQTLEMKVKLKGHDSFIKANNNSNNNSNDNDYSNINPFMRPRHRYNTRFRAANSIYNRNQNDSQAQAEQKQREEREKQRQKQKEREKEKEKENENDNGKNQRRVSFSKAEELLELERHGVTNTKTLSGGERSFTQIAFILALQQFSGSPFCIYDEFDVFMDSVNRGNSVRILIECAKNQNENRQYIFITPHDVSPMMKHGDEEVMKVTQLEPPRKV